MSKIEQFWENATAEDIEPVEPEPKHYVLRVGDSVETPSGHRVQVISRGETQRTYALTAGDGVTLPNGQTITINERSAYRGCFLFRLGCDSLDYLLLCDVRYLHRI
jgi:hypothetical protein